MNSPPTPEPPPPHMNCVIRTAAASEDIACCFETMRELRPHLTLEMFVTQVRRQQETDGYRLVLAEADRQIRAVAGYRLSECLAWGRFLYVDDLVTRAADQGKGFGSALFNWLVQEAQRYGCRELHLDSGLQRSGAHRFYHQKGMDLCAHHFALSIQSEQQ